MKDYIVYFEVFGKKMKTTIMASSKHAANIVTENKIKANTKILKIKELPDNYEDKDILNFFKGFSK